MSEDNTSGQGSEAAGATASEALASLGPGETADTVFELLSDGRRRRLVYVLDAYDDTITLADAADEVAEREHGAPLSEISADTVMQVYMSLYHSHVPKLVDAGVARYDQEQDLVGLVPADECEILDPLLTLVSETVEAETPY